MPPYPTGSGVRTFTTAQDIQFVRVHLDEASITGSFLVREKEIAHLSGNSEAIRAYLGLKDKPAYISDVLVPAGTRMQMGYVGPQPNFGLCNTSGFQYQLLERIPSSSFTNSRPLK